MKKIKEFLEGLYLNWLAYQQIKHIQKLKKLNPQLEEPWVGKFINGDFFLKTKDGKWFSENSLRELKLSKQ